jgi:DNA-binding transcriptional LysR family regulator
LKFEYLCAAIHFMDTKKMDLNLLVAFEALVTERNVTKAANRLNLSQPAMSSQLNRLRDLLGDQLFLPAQRGVIPTQRALELQEPVHEALERIRALVLVSKSFEPEKADNVFSIAASDYVQYVLLMPLALKLRSIAPKLQVSWRAMDGRVITDQMEKGEADVGMITPETAPDNLRSRTLFSESYVCVTRRNHPFVHQQLDLETFAKLEHVIVSPRGGGFAGPTDVALEALGYSRRVGLSIANFLMVPEVVARTDYIALVPKRLVIDRTDRLQLHEPPIKVAGFSISMIWHDRSTSHPAQRWLRETIVNASQEIKAD